MIRPYPFDPQGYSYEQAYYNYNPYYPPHQHIDYYYLYPQFNRKRQRRQAAAIVVESLWNNNNNNANNNETSGNTTPARKSTAQPRPKLTIPPKGIGPISDPNVNDVLCGRGGRINSHSGNVQFRDIIHSKKTIYLAPTTKKLEKAHIAAGVVNDIRSMNPPGRFLKEEKGTGMWYDIGDAKAIKKTGQALREDAPEIRPAIDIEGGSSGDEKKSPKKTEMGLSPQASPHAGGRNIMDQQQLNQAPILPQSQGFNNDFQGQRSMPPPFSNNGFSSQQASQQFMQQPMQNQQGFETRNIPIQMPMQANQSSYPSQMYARMQSATNKYGSASRKAMEALNQAGPTIQPQYAQYPGEMHPEEVAFGIPFHEPTNSRMMGDDVTISTISGLSEPLSSIKSKAGHSELMNMSLKSSTKTVGHSDLMNMSLKSSTKTAGNSELMNMSLKSGISLTDSLRLKNNFRGNSNHNRGFDPLMPGGFPGGSLRSGSARGSDGMGLTSSIKTFERSLTRSNSFPDNLNNESFRFDGDSNSHMFEDDLIGGQRARLSSGMSIGSLMDLQSNASSGQWYQAAVGNLPVPDDKSFMTNSMMSADIDALDLASTF